MAELRFEVVTSRSAIRHANHCAMDPVRTFSDVPLVSTLETPSFLFVFFVCIAVLWPSQPNGLMSSRSVYLTTLLLGRLSPLSG